MIFLGETAHFVYCRAQIFGMVLEREPNRLETVKNTCQVAETAVIYVSREVIIEICGGIFDGGDNFVVFDEQSRIIRDKNHQTQELDGIFGQNIRRRADSDGKFLVRHVIDVNFDIQEGNYGSEVVQSLIGESCAGFKHFYGAIFDFGGIYRVNDRNFDWFGIFGQIQRVIRDKNGFAVENTEIFHAVSRKVVQKLVYEDFLRRKTCDGPKRLIKTLIQLKNIVTEPVFKEIEHISDARAGFKGVFGDKKAVREIFFVVERVIRKIFARKAWCGSEKVQNCADEAEFVGFHKKTPPKSNKDGRLTAPVISAGSKTFLLKKLQELPLPRKISI